jgi:predicted nucleic acid-binding protein
VAATGLTTDQILRNYRRLAALVAARTLAQPVSRDAEDDAVLACARAARADLIITGDDDLLVLKHFEGISIVSPAQALDRVGTAERGTSGQGAS